MTYSSWNRDNRKAGENIGDVSVDLASLPDIHGQVSDFLSRIARMLSHYSKQSSCHSSICVIRDPEMLGNEIAVAQKIGQVPLLIVSDRPFDPGENSRFFHLDFPVSADRLRDKVKEILLG